MSDLISRKAAIDAISSMFAPTPVQKDMVEDCLEIIENFPSTEPKTGKWVDRSDGGRILNPWWESCECDQCGDYGSGAWNFCPNCGAKMKGEEE